MTVQAAAEADWRAEAAKNDLPRNERRAVTGYVPWSKTLHRLYNLAFSSLLLLMALPLLTGISIALFLTQGAPVFYRGERYGIGKKLFSIYKFRTLDSERAAELTQDGVLPADSGLETPLGGFLRATRLDELPQLLNVVFGDMNLIGPRPVRPEIAALYSDEIPDYDLRFSVKPGLLGHTQALMSHGTSKRVRARYNALLCRAPVRYVGEVGLTALVGFCVLARTVSQSVSVIRCKLLGVKRAPVLATRVDLVTPGNQRFRVKHLTDESIVLEDPSKTKLGCHVPGCLVVTLPNGQIRRARIEVEHPLPDWSGSGVTAFSYQSASDVADHIITRYILESVVVPHHSMFLPAQIARRFRRKKHRDTRRAAVWREQETSTGQSLTDPQLTEAKG